MTYRIGSLKGHRNRVAPHRTGLIVKAHSVVDLPAMCGNTIGGLLVLDEGKIKTVDSRTPILQIILSSTSYQWKAAPHTCVSMFGPSQAKCNTAKCLSKCLSTLLKLSHGGNKCPSRSLLAWDLTGLGLAAAFGEMPIRKTQGPKEF